jgi:hypothetical protein
MGETIGHILQPMQCPADEIPGMVPSEIADALASAAIAPPV